PFRPGDAHRARSLTESHHSRTRAPGRARPARARDRPALAARGVALPDGAPGLVRRDNEGATPARLAAPLLERRRPHPDIRLVPRPSRPPRRGRNDAPRTLESAGARRPQAPKLAAWS